MTARIFFFRLLLVLGGILLVLALANWLVNPIRLFAAPDILGFNYYKTVFFMDTFVSKPYVVSRTRPDAILLGTSRAGAALKTDHPGWAGYRAYNFALPGSTALVQWRNFQHASAAGEVRLAVVPLDFLMFNSCNDQSRLPHFREYLERLKGGDSINWRYAQRLLNDYLAELTAWDALRKSWQTVQAQQLFGPGRPGVMHLLADGFWQSYPALGTRQRKVFQRTERQYVKSSWFPAPLNCFQLTLDGEAQQLQHLRKLVAQAYQQGTSVILYFSPFHARFAEAMQVAGLWPQFEELKRQVVHMNASLAEAAGRETYPLWDFSGFNTITTEPVPPLTDKRTRMKYFFDGTHATPATGKLVQDRIFLLHSPGEQVPADFGVRLRQDNVQQVLLADRQARASWLAANPADVAEIAALTR